MTKKEAIELLDNLIGMVEDNQNNDYDEALKMGIKALENQKTLREELMKFRGGITDENVLIGFNMAIAICNVCLGEENKE